MNDSATPSRRRRILTGPCIDGKILFRCRRKCKSATELRRTAPAPRRRSAVGDQLPHHQAMDLQEENSQRADGRRTSPHPAEPKSTNFSSGLAAKRKRTAASAARVSGRNQLVGRIDSRPHQRPDGRGHDFRRRTADYFADHRDPAREMKLKKGQTAAALIKATEVMIIRV